MKVKTLQVRDWVDGKLLFASGINSKWDDIRIEIPKHLVTEDDGLSGMFNFFDKENPTIILNTAPAVSFVGDYKLINIKIVEIEVE